MSAILNYKLEEWKADMHRFVVANWNATSELTTKLINRIVDECESEMTGVSAHLTYHFHSEYQKVQDKLLNSIKEIDDDPKKTVKMRIAVSGYYLASSNEEENAGLRNHRVWQKITKKLQNEFSEYGIAQKHYDEAVELWWGDKSTSEINAKQIPFTSAIDRGESDILNSPNQALSISNVLYSDKEQGIPPIRSLVGFMVRDLFTMLALLQDRNLAKMLNDNLTIIKASNESGDLFAQHLKQSIQERDLSWWTKTTLQ